MVLILGGTALLSCASTPTSSERSPHGAENRGADSGTIRIGALFPMQGSTGLYGQDSVIAAQMAIDEINERGGVAGYKLAVTFADSEANPRVAIDAATEFVTKHRVHFLLGGVSSTVGLVVSEISREHKVIFIGTDHASTKLTIERLHPLYFRVSNNTFQSMAAGALFLEEKRDSWKTLVYIGPNYSYGMSQFEELTYNLDRFAVEYRWLGSFFPELFEDDYSSYIRDIAKLAPDYLVLGFWGEDTIRFLEQADRAGLLAEVKVLHPDAGGDYDVLAAMGERLPQGLVLSARHHVNWPDTDRNRAYVARFFERAGRYPTYAAEGAYAGVLAIAAAVQATGDPTDTDGLVTALENLRLPLPEDPPGFTSYMRRETHQLVQYQAIGITAPSDLFPPAKRLLLDWHIYPAEQLLPPLDYVAKRRAEGDLAGYSIEELINFR